jgi:hypothetical protein
MPNYVYGCGPCCEWNSRHSSLLGRMAEAMGHALHVYLMGVHPTGVHLIGVCFIGVYLTGVYVMGMHLISMYLIGVYIIGVYIMGVHHRYTYLLPLVVLTWPHFLFWRRPQPFLAIEAHVEFGYFAM